VAAANAQMKTMAVALRDFTAFLLVESRAPGVTSGRT